MNYSKYDKVRLSDETFERLDAGGYSDAYAEWADGHRNTVFEIWEVHERGWYTISSPIACANNWQFHKSDLKPAELPMTKLPEDLFEI